MSKAVARLVVSSMLSLLISTIFGASAFGQSPLAPNSIQVSRMQYDGNAGNTYVSPYPFPEIFNDPAGCNTTNQICNIAGIQGSIWIDNFNSTPGSATQTTSLSLPSTGTPVTTFPTQEPGSYITTSFGSKSEGALMLSANGQFLTYMGYQANDQLDSVSNSYSLNPANDLSPNTYTMDSSLGTPISIVSASESGSTATITLSSAVTLPAGSYFTIAGMVSPFSGYNGTWPTTLASNNSTTITLGSLPKNLTTCTSACGTTPTATWDVPYGFYDREVALIGANGLVSLTPIDNTNSGDNPRAAITVDGTQFYIVGNSDSTTASPSSGPNNPGLTIGARCGIPEFSQSYQLGTYVATDRPDESAKKHFKDNNWRGVGIYTDGSGNKQLYVSKGSGGNGDDGVFQVGSPLPNCTQGGTDTTNTITELLGAQATVPGGQSFQTSPYLSFGFWMANPTTLYVADEGNPPTFTGGASPSFQNSTNGTFTLPQLADGSFASDPFTGLEKWSLVNGKWTLDYTIQAGLNLYQPQTFPNYNDINGNPIQSYTYGIRNMSGFNNADGTVTIYAITAQFSAVSGGEPDPTSLVGITDTLAATSLPPTEQFTTLQTSAPGEVFRGVAYVPPAQGFTRAAQTINFTSPTQVTYGTAPITLAATATSGWPVTLSLTSGPATLSGNVLTITGAGQVVVSATQTGNTDFVPVTTSQTIVVAPAVLTVLALDATMTYGGPFPTFGASTFGFVNGDNPSSVLSGLPSFTTSATSASGVGAYPIIPSQGSMTAANYTFNFINGTLTISPASLFVTPNSATTTFGTIPNFTAAITGFVNNDNSSVVSGSPSLTTTATTTSPVGTYPINASQGSLSAANYNFTFGTGTLTINQVSQSISFSVKAPSTDTYNSMFTVVASATSGLPITYSSAGSCTNSGATYTINSGSGNCILTASQPGDTNHTAASPVSETTTAERATQTVSFTGAPKDAPFNSTFVLLATTNSTASAFITATDPAVCQVSGNFSPVTVTILKGAGACKFTASWGADANFTTATATQTTTAIKATPVITWTTPAAIIYGTPLSSTQLDASANVPGTITYTPAAGAIKTSGSSALKATFVPTVAADYVDTSTTVTLQVLPAATTTSITSSSATETLNIDGVAGATLDFNVSSYRPTGSVTLTASTGEVCSGPVNATTGNGMCRLTFTTTGARTITASYSGDSNHTGSNSSAQSPAVTVTVNPH